MYEFRDIVTEESSDEITLPSEAICFNGQWFDLAVPGFTTLNVSGRELLESEIEDLQIGSSDGVRYRKKRYPSRTIVVTYRLCADSSSAFRKTYNQLNKLLDVEQAKLIFHDEADKYFVATKAGNGEITPGQNCVIGEIEFYCADPFKYSEEIYEVAPTLDDNTTFLVDYKGTCKSYPVLETNFPDDNGYAAFLDADGHILQFGDPDEVDTEYVSSETLIKEAPGENISGWTLNNAVTTGQLQFQQTGSFKETTRHGESCIEVASYGTGTQYHGPSATKQIPLNAAGQRSQNFIFQFTIFLVVASKSDIGISQFVITDENRKNVAAMTFYKNTTSNYNGRYKLSVNSKVVREGDFSLESYNSLTSWKNGYCYMEKFEDMITFKVGELMVESFRDPAIKNMKAKEISFYFGGFSNGTIAHCGVRRVRFTAHNVNTWADIPNKFSQGDMLVADCKEGTVTLGNISEPGLGALGNDWENFCLYPGNNQIKCLYSSWAQKPEFKLRYREVYL